MDGNGGKIIHSERKKERWHDLGIGGMQAEY
jgi:hypothetical protein